MDEKYIQELYNQLGGKNKFGDYKDFQGLITTNTDYQKAFHKEIGEKVLGNFNDFSTLVKKKDGTPTTQPTSSNLQGGVATQKPISTPSQLSESYSPINGVDLTKGFGGVIDAINPKEETTNRVATKQMTAQERQQFEQRAFGNRPSDIATTIPANKPIESKQEVQNRISQTTDIHKRNLDEALTKTAKYRIEKNAEKKGYLDKQVSKDEQEFKEKELRDEYNKGNLVLQKDPSGGYFLSRPQGFFESMKHSLNESIDAPIAAFDINKAAAQGNDSKLVELIEERKSKQEQYLESVDAGKASSFFGNLIGSAPKPLAMIGASEVTTGSPVAGAVVMGAEQGWSNFQNNLTRLYDEELARNPNATKEEAMAKARVAATKDIVADVASGVTMGMMGGGEQQGLFKSVVNRLPNQTAKEVFVNAAKNTLKHASKFGAIGGGAEALKTGFEATSGYERDINDILKSGIEGFKDMALMDMAFKVISPTTYTDLANAPKFMKSAAKEYLATLPDHLVDRTLFELGEKGETIKQSLDKYRQIRSQFEGVVPENQVGTFAGWQEKINSLKEKNVELQNKINPNITEVANEPLKKQIAANDAEIAKAEDTLKEYLEKGKIVEKDNLTGDVLNEPIKEENVTAENVNAIKKAYNEDLSDIDNKITNLDKNKYDYQFELDDLTKQRNEIVDYYENQLKNEQSKKVPTTTRPETPSIEEAQKPIEPTNESITGVAEPISTEEISPAKEVIGETVQTPTEEVKVEPQPNEVSSKGGELKVTDKTKDILDEVTDEKIGEKKYQDFKIDFEDGARAFGTIENGVANISGINAPKENGTPIRGTKTYERVLDKLKEQGVKTVNIKLQSEDSAKAIDKLVEKGILTNPRNKIGSSGNERNVTFDIGLKEQSKPTEVKAEQPNVSETKGETEKVVTKPNVSDEPPLPKGETIVTPNGLTESERQVLIEKRKKSTAITEQEKTENGLVSLTKKRNVKGTLPTDKRNIDSKISQLVRKLNAEAGYEKYRYNNDGVVGKSTTVRKGSIKGATRFKPLSEVNRDANNGSIKEDAVVFAERPKNVRDTYDNLLDADQLQHLHVLDASGKKAMSKDQISAAMSDIENGIPSVAADNLLNTIEQATKDGNLPVIESGFKIAIPLDDVLNIKKEVVGEPFDEKNLISWLNDESHNLTPEHQQILDNELNNIIYEHEQGGIETEIPKSESTTETTSSKVAEPKVSDATVDEKAQPTETKVETPKAEKSEPIADKERTIGKYEKLAIEYAKKIDKVELPSWAKIDDANTNKQGGDYDSFKKALSKSVIEMGKLLDEGVEFAKAAKEAISHLLEINPKADKKEVEDWFTNHYKENIDDKTPPINSRGDSSGVHSEQPPMSFRKQDFTRAEHKLGLDEHVFEGKTTKLKAQTEAARTIEEWKKNGTYAENILQIEKDGIKGKSNLIEQFIYAKHLADLDATVNSIKDINSKEFDDALSAYNKALKIAHEIRSFSGQQLGTMALNDGEPLTLAEYLTKEMQNTGLDELTDAEKKNLSAEFTEMQEIKKQLAERDAENERLRNELKAKKNFTKSKSSSKSKKTHDDFVAERKSLKDELKEAKEKHEKWLKDNGISTAGASPFTLTTDMAKIIGKMVKSHAEETVLKFDELVNRVFEEAKDILDGISRKDIIDVMAGVYEEKKATRNEKAALLRDLKTEAKLINELEALRLGKVLNKPTERIQKSARIKELEAKVSEIRQRNKNNESIEKQDWQRLDEKKARLKNEISKLEKDIKNGDFAKEDPKPTVILDKEGQLLQDRLNKLQSQQEIRKQKAEYEKLSWWNKTSDKIWQVLGLKRLVNAAIDFSIAFRQASPITFNFLNYLPKKNAVTGKYQSGVAVSAWAKMFNLSFSPKKFERYQHKLENSNLGKIFQHFGGVFSNPLEVKMDKREEEFSNNILSTINNKIQSGNNETLKKAANIADKVWFSERASAAFLNTCRSELFENGANALLREGITPDNSPEHYKALVKWIMNTTGRGNMLKVIEDSHAGRVFANRTYFGARLMAAKINMLNPITYKNMPKEVRVQAIKDMAGYTVSLVLTGLAVTAAGGQVSLNPDEPDFMQARFGDKVYDLTGGSVAYVRTFLRFTTAMLKQAKNFGSKDANSYSKFAGSSIAKTLVTNKLSPNTAYLYHTLGAMGFPFAAKSSKYTDSGKLQPYDPYEIAKVYPLYVDGTVEAYKKGGLLDAMTILVPDVFGIGTQQYDKKGSSSNSSSGTHKGKTTNHKTHRQDHH